MARRNKIEWSLRVKDDASANLQKVSKEVDGVTGSLGKLAGAVASVASLNEIARLADTYRLLQNRLRLVTKSTAELNAVTNELTKISLRSRTSFQATADLYARVARSSRELGLSQQELLDFTETVSKSIRISGSTSQEAAAGVIQFGQALASSRLSGDELRSVLEQMPRLAQAIAEGMEVGIGTLRELGEAGELIATKVLGSLEKAGPEIAAEFARLLPLVSEAFTNLNSSVTVAIGRLDEFFGISKFAAEAIIEIADDVLLLGKALTGSLEPGERMGEVMQRIAIFALVAAGAIKVLMESVKAVGSRQFETVGEFFGALAAQIATGGSMDQIDAITDAFKERLDGIWSEEDLDAKRDEIILGVTDMMEKIGKIIGDFPRVKVPGFDLTDKPEGGDEESRKVRDARRSALKTLEKMLETIEQSNQAFAFAAAIGLEYAEALQIVKAEALGAASGNRELQLEVLRQLEINRALKAEAQALEDAAKAAQKATERELKFIEDIGEQAARNIQTAFADFLFDPFEDGIKGMLKGFVNAIRRMIAEMLAFQIIQQSAGFLGLSAFFTPKAAGGPVSAGQPLLVGERGPEIFIPGASGTIRNNSALRGGAAGAGGVTFISNIDARGADPALITRLPQILDQRDRKLMLNVQKFLERGGVAI